MRRPTASTSSGLTLVETLTVLAVVAVLAAVAAPAFESMLQARRLSGAASLLMSDLQNARSEAVLRNSGIVVTLSSDNYTVTTASAVASLPAGTELRKVMFTNGNLLSGASVAITYDPRRGRATPAASVTLSNGSHSLEIGVNSMGRVQCAVVSGSPRC